MRRSRLRWNAVTAAVRWNGDDGLPIAHAGIENLTLESEFDAANPRDEDHSWIAVRSIVSKMRGCAV